MDPGASFHCKGPSIFSTFYGLTQMEIIIGYIFQFYATKMGSRESGETKVDPYWVQDPLWSFNGPCHGPTIHLTWSYHTPNMALYILAIFLHSMQQKWDQGTLGTQRSAPMGSRTLIGPSMDPATALQYTQHGPLYIGFIFAFYATKLDQGTWETKVDLHWVQDLP